MTPTEERILSALAAGRTTLSVVTLAADIWRGPADVADPVGLFTLVLEDLNARGLVTYTVRESDRYHPRGGLPCQIRLTQDGWAAAGYPTVTPEVGTRDVHKTAPRQPNDRTDYLTHRRTATYSTVTLERLEEHEANNPRHYHRTEYDDPMNALGQWRCIQCGGPMLRQGVCLVGCRRPGQ